MRSQVILETVSILDNSTSGLYCTSTSRCLVNDLTASGNIYALYAARAAQIRFDGPASITSNNFGGEAAEGATIDLAYRSDITVLANTVSSLLANEHGRVLNYGNALVAAPECTATGYGLCRP